MRSAWSLLCLILITSSGVAQQPVFHGAASVYYSYSVQRPPDHLRLYSTQPARNGEIAVDLAVASMTWSTEFVDVDVALQAGTWADANYVGDDANWKVVNQAYVRLKPDSVISFGAGIGPSHIGQEGAINAKNMLYTRSLIADNTPYYNAMVDVTFAPSQQWKFALYVMNGWQQIVDVNDELSFGSKIDWQASSSTLLSWNTYVGNDEPNGDAGRLRLHSNFYLDHRWNDQFRSVLLFDVGARRRSNGGGFDKAYYVALKSSWQATSLLRIGGRVEYMHDPWTILVMNSPEAFKVVGASLGCDLTITPQVMGRFEVRGWSATESVFPAESGLRRRDLFFTVGLSTYM